MGSNFRYRNMSSHQSDTQFIFHQDHQRLLSFPATLLQIFRMSGEMEHLILYIVLINRCRNQDINLTSLQISHCRFQSLISCLTSNSRRLGQFHFDIILYTINQVYAIQTSISCLRNHIDIDRRQIHRFPVVSRHFG